MWECLMQELSPSDDEMKVFLVEFGNLSQGSTLNPSIRLHGSLSVGSVSTELGLISLLPPLETMLKHKQHAFRLRWALSLISPSFCTTCQATQEPCSPYPCTFCSSWYIRLSLLAPRLRNRNIANYLQSSQGTWQFLPWLWKVEYSASDRVSSLRACKWLGGGGGEIWSPRNIWSHRAAKIIGTI